MRTLFVSSGHPQYIVNFLNLYLLNSHILLQNWNHIYIVIQAYYSYNNSCYYASVGEHNLSLVITLKFTFGDFAGGIPVQIKLGNSIFHRFYEEDKHPLLRKIN